MAFELPKEVYSPSQVGALLRELADYREAVGEAARVKKVTGKPKALPEESVVLHGLTKGSTDDAFLAELEENLRRVVDKPCVSVTLPGLPTERLKLEIVSWFRRLNPTVLVSFMTDRTLAGGIVVRTEHTLHDWSWRRRLWENRHALARIATDV